MLKQSTPLPSSNPINSSKRLLGLLFTALLATQPIAGWSASPQPAATAQAASPIVGIAQLEAAQARGAIVWDVRAVEDYKKGHIPGAINIGDAGKVLRDDHREDFIPTARIEQIFSEAGLDPSKEIIVYGGRGNPYAYFGRFTIRYFGGTKVSVFHDGIEGWQEAGKAIAKEPSVLFPAEVKLSPVTSLAVTTDEVSQRFQKTGVQVLDVRTAKEFAGEDIRAIRGGHIPGALNIPFEENWQDPVAPQKIARKEVNSTAGLSLKDQGALSKLYQKLDRNKETIVYCQSGVRASETATVLESLGFKNVKVYDSSWLGWAARLSAPVEDETFLNVGLLNGQLAALKRRLDELEKLRAN